MKIDIESPTCVRVTAEMPQQYLNLVEAVRVVVGVVPFPKDDSPEMLALEHLADALRSVDEARNPLRAVAFPADLSRKNRQ